jgi:D-ribulokinase
MADTNNELVLGIDVGTGGVRAVAVSEDGAVIAAGQAALPAARSGEGTIHEQDPHQWWTATQRAVEHVSLNLHRANRSLSAVRGVCVDGTSGTLVCLDERLEPLRPAIMYNDARAAEEGTELTQLAAAPIQASFAIAKARWVQRREPGIFRRTRWLAHQADFILWRLLGGAAATDYSNALKTGYDLREDRWPAWLESLGELRQRLPDVVAPGTAMGHITRPIAELLRLPADVQVISGMTDGTAGFFASGAHRIGDDNTTLGTTLVFKRLCDHYIADPSGLIYCHRVPGGLWLPGAASNTGGQWLRALHDGADLAALDRAAAPLLPSPRLAWPLIGRGERFPIHSATLTGFCDAPASDIPAAYAARLQGTAMVERLCCEALDGATGTPRGDVYATGGGAASDTWMQLRADVTGRVYHRPSCPQAAFGAAVLAAGTLWFKSPLEAVQAMVRIGRSFEPRSALRDRYESLYESFGRRVAATAAGDETRARWRSARS